jgi:hypothetical protein
MDAVKQKVRIDVMYKGEPDAATRELIDQIECAVAERMRAGGVQRFAVVVGAQAAPQEVRATLEAIA